MVAVVLLSHGSLLCGAGLTLAEHARRLRAMGDFGAVEVGFLNYNEPSFEAAVERCVEAGAHEVRVLPYFLVPGKFVRVDLPPRIVACRQAYPAVSFTLCDPIGYHPDLAPALAELAAAAGSSRVWRAGVRSAAEHCEATARCPLYNTPNCPRTQPAQAPQAVAEEPPAAGGPVALAVLVHGSPRAGANEAVYRTVESLKASGNYAAVEIGFLECNEPDIPTALARCAETGATTVTAVPYFLHTGSHVAEDLPQHLEEAQPRFPGVRFLLADYLGRSPRITTVLAERARAPHAIADQTRLTTSSLNRSS